MNRVPRLRRYSDSRERKARARDCRIVNVSVIQSVNITPWDSCLVGRIPRACDCVQNHRYDMVDARAS